jgi:hypothetical protein
VAVPVFDRGRVYGYFLARLVFTAEGGKLATLKLPAEALLHLVGLSDMQLKLHGAVRRVAENSGYPCRVSLTDSRPGDDRQRANAHAAADSWPRVVRFLHEVLAPDMKILFRCIPQNSALNRYRQHPAGCTHAPNN